MEPTTPPQPMTQARGRSRSWIAALVLGTTIVLGGAASVFAASPSASASPNASAGTGSDDGSSNGTTAHNCPDRTDDSGSGTDSST